MQKKWLTSGQVAARVGLPRWRLLYLIERGAVPGPSVQVPGRRLYTATDVDHIAEALEQQPDLRRDGQGPVERRPAPGMGGQP
jgi:hypothetical protein